MAKTKVNFEALRNESLHAPETQSDFIAMYVDKLKDGKDYLLLVNTVDKLWYKAAFIKNTQYCERLNTPWVPVFSDTIKPLTKTDIKFLDRKL